MGYASDKKAVCRTKENESSWVGSCHGRLRDIFVFDNEPFMQGFCFVPLFKILGLN